MPLNLTDFLSQFCRTLLYVVTKSPMALPFWAAVAWLLLLLARRNALDIVFRRLGVDDPEFERQIVNRIDIPLQLFLVLIAVSPFLTLAPRSIGRFLFVCADFVIALLAVHIMLQCVNMFYCKWYLVRRRKMVVPAVLRYVALSIGYAIALLALMDWVLGVNVIPLLATSTVIAAVLGLALQDTLKNVVAGLTMSMERTYRQGDWIKFRSTDDVLTGQIVEIGWRSTKVRSSNNNTCIIPNVQLASVSLVNFSSPYSVQALEINFPVDIHASAEGVSQALKEAASSSKDVLKEPEPRVYPTEINLTSINYRLVFWIEEFDKRTEIVGAVLEAGWQKLAQMRVLP